MAKFTKIITNNVISLYVYCKKNYNNVYCYICNIYNFIIFSTDCNRLCLFYITNKIFKFIKYLLFQWPRMQAIDVHNACKR